MLSLIVSVVGTLAVQLVLGRLAFGIIAWGISRWHRRRRRSLVVWAESSRALKRASPFALAILIGSVALTRSVAMHPLVVWHSAVAFLVIGAWPTSHCYLVLHSTWSESRGRLRAARRQMRFAGQAMFAGVVLLMIVIWWDLIMNAAFRRAMLAESGTTGLVLLVAMVGMGCGAFLALVAGLAGKPRPSAYIAALLYATGLAGIVVAAGMAT